jgi:hypothetical protein
MTRLTDGLVEEEYMAATCAASTTLAGAADPIVAAQEDLAR